MTSRQDILDAVNQGFEQINTRFDQLETAGKGQDQAVDAQDDAQGVAFTLEEYYANEFQSRPVPFTGRRRINKSFRKDPGHFTCFQFKLKAVEGDITIKIAEASSDNPTLEPRFNPVQMRAERVIKQGSWMIFRCQTKLPGSRTDIDFKIAIDDGTDDGETIIDLTADFSSQIQPEPAAPTE